jgi:hypothetical protein
MEDAALIFKIVHSQILIFTPFALTPDQVRGKGRSFFRRHQKKNGASTSSAQTEMG